MASKLKKSIVLRSFFMLLVYDTSVEIAKYCKRTTGLSPVNYLIVTFLLKSARRFNACVLLQHGGFDKRCLVKTETSHPSLAFCTIHDPRLLNNPTLCSGRDLAGNTIRLLCNQLEIRVVFGTSLAITPAKPIMFN